MAREREFHFTDKDFDCLRKLVGARTGIVLSNAKKDMVYSRLARRVRQLGLDSFSSYCSLVQDDSANSQEMVNLTNAITTNLTSFFRESHHFDYLGATIIPELRGRNGANKRIRIWSAGCSTGEEPYSIAITLRDGMRDIDSWDVRLLATDLDTNVLETASKGVYKDERIEGLDGSIRKRWFLKGRDGLDGMVRAREQLRNLITFKQLNLMGDWPLKGPLDVVFCRNVVIYFDLETQKRLIDRFANLLAPGGYLIMGHSENLHKVTRRFKLIGKTIYQLDH